MPNRCPGNASASVFLLDMQRQNFPPLAGVGYPTPDSERAGILPDLRHKPMIF
jgi:hypothetical protein